MFLLIILCALIGLWIRGSSGFFVGAMIGFVLGYVARAAVRKKLQQVQVRFIDTTFAVMGALCKADGVVTRDEIQMVEQIFARLHLSREQKDAAKAAFNRGKAPDFDLEAELGRLARAPPHGRILF